MVPTCKLEYVPALFDAFTRASWSQQSRDREGHLQELVTNQVAQAIQTAVQATTLIVAALAFLVLVASALALNVLAALVVLVATAPFAGSASAKHPRAPPRTVHSRGSPLPTPAE